MPEEKPADAIKEMPGLSDIDKKYYQDYLKHYHDVAPPKDPTILKPVCRKTRSPKGLATFIMELMYIQTQANMGFGVRGPITPDVMLYDPNLIPIDENASPESEAGKSKPFKLPNPAVGMGIKTTTRHCAPTPTWGAIMFDFDPPRYIEPTANDWGRSFFGDELFSAAGPQIFESLNRALVTSRGGSTPIEMELDIAELPSRPVMEKMWEKLRIVELKELDNASPVASGSGSKTSS